MEAVREVLGDPEGSAEVYSPGFLSAVMDMSCMMAVGVRIVDPELWTHKEVRLMVAIRAVQAEMIDSGEAANPSSPGMSKTAQYAMARRGGHRGA